MTPKQKAQDLVNKFIPEVNPYHSSTQRHKDNNKKMKRAKLCALKTVDEIIDAIEMFGYTGAFFDHPETGEMQHTGTHDPTEYYRQVKTEIESYDRTEQINRTDKVDGGMEADKRLRL